MECKLVKLSLDMGKLEYDMYQDIPSNEVGSSNKLYGKTYEDFLEYIKDAIKAETIIDQVTNSTSNKYIFYVDNYPVGEIVLRTTINDFWLNKGSQVYYKIRLSERKKGYGTIMLKLVLEEASKLGFTKVCINCDDNNIGSKKVILNNNGKLLFNYGTSSRYEIIL